MYELRIASILLLVFQQQSLRDLSFFGTKKQGAAYGDLDGMIRLEARFCQETCLIPPFPMESFRILWKKFLTVVCLIGLFGGPILSVPVVDRSSFY